MCPSGSISPIGTAYVTVAGVLEPHTAVTSGQCRCGTPLAPGTVCVSFAHPPEAARDLVAGLPFCGVLCARAFLLEALELLEPTSAAGSVQDRDRVLAAIAGLYAQLVAVSSATGR